MRTILAIDDQLDNLTTIKAVVKAMLPNIKVIVAQSGKQGILLANENNPDAILLDIIMPEMDGFDVCKILKNEKATQHIPIMIVTAIQTDLQSKAKALELGADAFVTKPFEPVELIAQLKVILRTKEAEDNLREERNNLKEIVQSRTKELQESELKYRSVVESTQEPILVIQNGRVKFSNTITATLSGYTNEELENSSFIEHVYEEDKKTVLGKYRKRVQGEKLDADNEFRIVCKSGKKLWFSFITNTIEWEGENALLYILNNITEKRELEKQKIINAERDKVLLELYNMSFSAKDKAIFDFVLDKAVKITQSQIGFFHQFNEDLNKIQLTAWNHQALKHCNADYDSHYPMDKAGNWVDCVRERRIIIYNDFPNSPNQKGLPEGHVGLKNYMSVPVMLNDKIFYIFGIGNKGGDYNDTDKQNLEIIANELSKILEKRKYEEEIKRSTEKYLAIHNNAPLPFQSLNENGNIVEVNPAWLKLLGYQKEEVIGRWYGDLLHKDYVSQFKLFFPKLKEKGKTTSVLFKLQKKNGEFINIKLDGSCGYSKAGEFLQSYCTFKNVTEEVKQQLKLETSEAKYRSFAEHFDGIALKGFNDYSVDFMSGKVEEITGYKEQDFINGTIKFRELIHPQDKIRMEENIRHFNVSKSNSIQRKYRIINRNKEIKWLQESISKFQENGKNGVYGTIQDITTEVTSLEQIKFQSEILHNFNEGVVLVEAKNKTIIYNNTSFRKMFGYEKGELFGKHINDLNALTTKNPGEIGCGIESELSAKGQWSGEIKNITKSGDEFWCDAKVTNYKHPKHGEVWICIHVDITERKLKEAQIAEQTQHLETIHASAPISFWIYEIRDGKYYFIYQNKTAAENINTSDEEMIGKSLSELVPSILNAEGVFSIEEKFAEVVNTKKPVKTKGSLDIKGQTYWWMAVYSPLFNEKGEVCRIIMSSVSIDEQIQKENKLKESEIRNKSFVEHFQGIAFRKNSQNQIDLIEGNVEEITGFKSNDFMSGKINPDILIHPDDLKRVKTKDKQFEESNATKLNSEFRIIDKSGSIHWVYETTTKYTVNEQTGIYGTLQDITQLKATERNTYQLTEAIEQSPGCVVITDLSGKVEYVNPAFSEITGYAKEEVIGQKTSVLKSGHHDDSFYKDMWDVLSDGRIWRGEFYNKKKNGEFFWENASITPVKNKEGEVINYLAVKEDITEKKKILNDLRVAKEKAEESDTLKTAFLANMSHEIRTPMNGILGFLDLLDDANLSQGEKELFFSVIKSSGERLLNTINDIIELSKIEAGEIPLTLNTQDIGFSLQYQFDFFNLETKAKGIKLEYEYSELLVETDFHKLDSILTNLIKNAIKFTKSGTISFGFKPLGNNLQFFVRDSGIGIAPARINAIFDRFIQADNSLSRGYEGSGLGLSICKAYVEMLGGKIWVESEVDKGSTFYFTIKHNSVIQVDESLQKPTQLAQNGDNEKIQILVAEDDEVSFVLLKALLTKSNYQLIRAINGKDALTKLEENPDVALILMDLKMPKMDGYSATKCIREFDKNIPIIAQTAFSLLGDKEKALEAGCTDYISKPVKKHQLIQMLEKYLHKT